jgi:hypothetical protein
MTSEKKSTTTEKKVGKSCSKNGIVKHLNPTKAQAFSGQLTTNSFHSAVHDDNY